VNNAQYLGFIRAYEMIYVATQEERIFGSNPALLPSVLMTPPLSVTQSLIITGDTQVYGHLTGHLRSAQLREIYTCAERSTQNRTGRSFLFLDALEMDGEKHGRDVEMKNMLREINKLMSGFNALLHSKKRNLPTITVRASGASLSFSPLGVRGVWRGLQSQAFTHLDSG